MCAHRWVLLIAAAVLVAACGSQPPGAAVDAREVETAATLPEVDGFSYADIATDRGGLAEVRERFGLTGEAPEVDLDRDAVLVVGFGESSSCPATFEGVNVDRDGDLVTVRIGQDGRDCTDDHSPRTLAIAVERSALPGGGFVLDLDRVGDRSHGAFTLATAPTATPPDGPDVIRTLGTDDLVDLSVDAVPWDADGSPGVDIVVDNRTEHPIRGSGPLAALDRWDEQRWLPDGAQPDFGAHPAITLRDQARVGSGERGTIATVDTGDLDPGWYAVRIGTSPDGPGGRTDVRTAFEVQP